MARKRAFLGRKKFRLRLKKTTLHSLAAVLLFFAAGLIWISFIRQGLLLSQINSLLIAQFGFLPALFLPFPFLVGGLMITKIKSSLGQPHVFIGSFIIIAAATGLVRTGQLGQRLWQNVTVFLSPPGTWLFLLAGAGVGFIIMLNVPFEDLLNFFVTIF